MFSFSNTGPICLRHFPTESPFIVHDLRPDTRLRFFPDVLRPFARVFRHSSAIGHSVGRRHNLPTYLLLKAPLLLFDIRDNK